MRIFINGVHSGANPSAGLGIARCLREAYPAAELVAVDHSCRSTGLHDATFDRVWIPPPWEEIDRRVFCQQVAHELRAGALWLSALDVETRLLATALNDEAAVLGPSVRPLEETEKPWIFAAESLAVDVPECALRNPATMSSTDSVGAMGGQSGARPKTTMRFLFRRGLNSVRCSSP